MTVWYAAHTQPCKEALARHHLERQGFGVYLPQYLKRRKHARKIDFVPAPLFPRYLFVGGDGARMRWRSIGSTIGVAKLVSFGDSPAIVPADIICSLQAIEDERGLVVLARSRRFAAGETVQFLHEALGDITAVITNLDAQNRVTLLLDLLGREVKVTAPLDRITASV